jgi:hypothetical protein
MPGSWAALTSSATGESYDRARSLASTPCHLTMLLCDGVVVNSENVQIHKDVCILSVLGTAAKLRNIAAYKMKSDHASKRAMGSPLQRTVSPRLATTASEGDRPVDRGPGDRRVDKHGYEMGVPYFPHLLHRTRGLSTRV